MDRENFYRISIKGIVVDGEGRFLLAKEEDGTWELLGGGLDHGETPQACLKRELFEETGLNVTYISDNPKYFVTTYREAKNYYIANIIYEIKLENLDFVPSDECIELRFFTPEEALKEKLFPSVESFIKQFNPANHY